MNLSTIIFIIGLLGAVFGVKRPWLGGFAGLFIGTSLFYLFISPNIIPVVIVSPIFFLLSAACGFICSIIYSGLKGKGKWNATTYMSGFGVHHPGGFILSNGERKVLKDKHLQREIVISY